MYKKPSIQSLPPEITQNIRAELMRAGRTLKSIAEEASVSPGAVTQNIRGMIRTPAVRQAICNATGFTEAELWQPEDIQEKKRASAG